MKKGRFSKTEQKFIKENHKQLSLKQIATQLDRDPDSIEAYISSKLEKKPDSVLELKASYDLKSRPFWRELQEQFSSKELQLILYHWGRIIGQFRDDVLPTEELQILDAIKLEVLMNRALSTQQKNMKDISFYEDVVTELKGRAPELQDKDEIYNIERQIAISRAAQDTLTRDYKDLQTKKAQMLKDLKATREQRIRRLEDSRATFIGWVQNLMTNPEIRQELGKEMEKMRLAMYKEQERLSEYHSYEDKMLDQPFLTPDTIE